MNNNDTGLLLHKKDIELHRRWFKQMTQLLGVNVLYRAPRDSKQFDVHGELDANYYEPEVVACIFDEHPTVQTTKKLGWNHERGESKPIIHVPYDLEKLQDGALFIIPSPTDRGTGRVFKVTKMSTTFIYPASIACELGPVLRSEVEKSQVTDFAATTMNVMIEERDEEDEGE